jgi:hypothetical protein
VSAREWNASANRPAEWVMRNPMNFEMAMPRLAANAAKIALRLPSVTRPRLDADPPQPAVRNGNLVTLVLDIEKDSDQIGSQPLQP